MAPSCRWRWPWTPFMVLLIASLLHYASTLELDTSQMEISEHPISPRMKRQAYPVYSTANGKVTVEIVGQREAGPWNDWIAGKDCSRTCGGGVKIETRECGGSGCIGPRKRYVSCNVEPCPQGAKDFRSAQCAENNDKPLQGRYYKWKPYTKAPNKCELNCMPDGESFYYKWADKVVDGTKCDQMSNDVCVEGFCLPLGCDGKLGSHQKEDKCRICGGDGTTCKTQKGFFDERHMAPGYIDIITLPIGSTSIVIQENKPTNNYLALRNETGHYFLNGNWKIDFPQTVEIAGTLFEYERTRQGTVGVEKLIAKGPTQEPVIVVLLFQAENTGIQYEYSIPLDETRPHIYLLDEWGQCSVTCGRGIQSRQATCVDSVTKSPVAEELCVNSSLPETNRTCNSIDCETEWFEGEWEQCSHTCGKDGLQYRTVYCHKVSADGTRVTIDDEECKNTTVRPAVKQNCNRFECPEWLSGPWSSCSKDCGDAKQYRAVTCRSEKEGEEGKLLAAKNCNDTLKPEDQRTCNLGPCEGLRWVTGDWDLCSKCNDTIETRNVSCENEHGRKYPEEKCKEKRPADSRDCATVIPCVYKWHSSQWSECSSECGHGHQTRSVVCAIDENGYLRKMDDSFCDAKHKLDNRQNCTHEGMKCTGTYYSSPWTNCTAECAGGTQTRIVVCFDYDYKIRPQMCDEDTKPPETQDCNTDRCLLCNETTFGCCPDKMTPATGYYYEGCSNCSLTEFGCCPDNYTVAQNAEKTDCPVEEEIDLSGEGPLGNDTMKNDTMKNDTMILSDCDMSTFGCCPGSNITATADQSNCPETICNFTSASGDTIMMPCVNATWMNDTLGNDTMFMDLNDTESNVTIEIHCSKTEFGCCSDWYTAANGTDFLGCPMFEIGTCNNTKHGCCPDGLTLARGPMFEGCGDPSCAASLFGCCKDRLTIAFGTHYAGCERANQPCETSKFGCCSDGLTAALGMKGEGCEEDCRLTKFGCCPDGRTTAKGKNNEGCKCSDSQYGCCPDGVTAAEGLGYHGCPDSCARSYYGCCPDGKTAAQGQNKEGCPCVYTQYGCCPDGETAARGPERAGCDDCRNWKFGCCADGITKALGPDRSGCDENMRATTGYTRPESGTVSPNKIAACTLPKVEGQVCADYTIMWYYDTREGACRQFWYGGCAGNDNRFTTDHECRDTCIEPPGTGLCYLPKIEGPQDCGDVKARWYYDLRRGQCQAFYYNGCNGNANNFEHYDECMNKCESVEIPGEPRNNNGQNGNRDHDEQRRREEEQRRQEEDDRRRQGEDPRRPDEDQGRSREHVSAERGDTTDFPVRETDREEFITPTVRGDHGDEEDPSTDVCDYPPESGPCRAFRDMWFFDRQSRQCSTFKYGGCDGNPNRFMARGDCEESCRHKLVSVPLEEPEVCALPAAAGPCGAKLQMWYYEPAWGRCTTFNYGGCDGNANRFDSEAQCQAKCAKTSYEVNGDQCNLPKDPGPCDIYVPKWYFNAADGTCGRFYYGGCHGNRNRFDALEECETKCASKLDPCSLPAVQGPCHGHNTRWHWDQKSRSCKQFTFNGCLGNSNNFLSANECELRCGSSNTGRSESLTGRTAVVSASVTEEQLKNDVCRLPPVSGRCGEYHYKYYFNSANSRCEAFVYSGCEGNDNRFDRLDDCEKRCSSRHRSQNYQSDVNGNDLHDMPEADAFRTRPQLAITSEAPEETTEGNDNDDICRLPVDKGPCRQHTLRWYFDTTTRKCKEFHYGGCLGNYNNFESLERCEEYCVADDQVPQGGLEKPRQNNVQEEIIEERIPPPQSYPAPTSLLPDLCKQQMDTGDCYEDLLRYYYDSEKQKCQSFKYTNCKGNSNRFLSMEECERACGQYRDPGVCALPADEGHCFASTNKWFWSSTTASCETFIYSGCGGNGNRFGSKEECEALCRKETETQEAEVCEMPKVVGPCRAALERYHYNIFTRQCEKFDYGGCRGNDNNFQTIEGCQERCLHVESDIVSDICLHTWDAGPCTEAVTQYYFDSNSGECKLFTYGGCRGNTNRFDTKNQCEARCKGKRTEAITMSKEAVCRQPFDHGPCNDQAVRYYYNLHTNKCETFIFGGCAGNENKFFSEKECTDTCSGVMSRGESQISSHQRSRESVNVIVEMSHGAQDSPTTVFLHCQVRPVQSHNIIWFKDMKRINANENQRFIMMRNGTLQIMSAVKEDGGNFTCAATDINNGLTSRPVPVEIRTQQHQTLKQCIDDPSKANCAMVKKSGLCDHKYYGVFCCKTCAEVKALKKAKKLKFKLA